jgi:hypothetical protein
LSPAGRAVAMEFIDADPEVIRKAEKEAARLAERERSYRWLSTDRKEQKDAEEKAAQERKAARRAEMEARAAREAEERRVADEKAARKREADEKRAAEAAASAAAAAATALAEAEALAVAAAEAAAAEEAAAARAAAAAEAAEAAELNRLPAWVRRLAAAALTPSKMQPAPSDEASRTPAAVLFANTHRSSPLRMPLADWASDAPRACAKSVLLLRESVEMDSRVVGKVRPRFHITAQPSLPLSSSAHSRPVANHCER